MSDLLNDARDLRQKLYRLELLLEIEKGGRRRAWHTRADQDRETAIRRLVKTGLIERTEPTGYRLTSEGRLFLTDVRAKVGGQGPLDWTRADEIDFAKL